jgi:hypothetical protein
MPAATKPRARPPAQEPLAAELGYDYADSFEVELTEPDSHTAEEWMRCALERAPESVRTGIRTAWQRVLWLRLGPEGSPDHVLGFPIKSRDPDVIRLETQSPFIRGVIIGRKVTPTRVAITTLVNYRIPLAARLIWMGVRPGHRQVVPSLLGHAAARI